MAVSIIIPTYNEVKFIHGLLESIEKYIKSDIEVIVVDNGSTDDTVSIASKYDCVLINLPYKVYPSVARNAGIKAANSDCMVFLDADVTITEQWANKLDKLVFQKEVCQEMFITGASYYVSKLPCWIENYWFEPLRKNKKNYINGGNIITNRKTVMLLQGFEESLETGEDVDFCLRAAEKGIEVKLDNAWKVHHEGFPKTIKEFVKRESWHGKGDFVSIIRLMQSKVAIATLFFVTMHFLLISSLVSYYFTVNSYNLAIFYTAGFLTLSLCYLRAAKDIKIQNIKALFVCTFISYLYFLGRSQSIIRAVRKN